MEQRELTCIGCPMGCMIVVSIDGGAVTKIEGNTCKIGENYATREVTAPRRIVTSTVKIAGGVQPVVPVKTKVDIPKEKIKDIMTVLKQIVVKAPVKIGDVIVTDICDTGVNIVATKEVGKV